LKGELKMFRRTTLAATTLATLAVSLMGLPANGGTGTYQYAAYTGGTLIRAVGTTISSDLTAQSAISGNFTPNSSTNRVSSVHVSTIANLGVVETSTTAANFGANGVRIHSHAKSAGINLLNGAIRADAVETDVLVTGVPGQPLVSEGVTKYVNLRIVGIDLPVNIPKNYKVTIPGVATVVINASYSEELPGGVLQHTGYGLGLWLLNPYQGAPTGSTIILNPTYAGMSPPVPVEQPTVGGYAYGTQVLASVGSDVKGQVGKTATVGVPPGSSGGRLARNTTATVKVPGVINFGAVTSTSQSFAEPGYADVTTTNEIAGLNLFSGLITADSMKVVATSKKQNGVLTRSMTLTFVNLVVAGNPINVNVAPNTTITVAGLGKVVINDQIKTFNANRIRGIYIKLLEPNGGLETGAEVEVAVAASWITQ
jgi:hypothetical protein